MSSAVSKTNYLFWWGRLFVPWWKAAAVAGLLLLAVLGVWRAFFHLSPVDRGLVALNKAYEHERPLEVRVSAISYAPHSTKRGAEPQNIDYRARDLSGSLLIGAVSDEPNASALHALGRFYLMQRELDKAILQFEEALKSSPDDAQLHSDLGAAM